MAVPGELRDGQSGGAGCGRVVHGASGYHGTWLLKSEWSFENQKRRCNEHSRKKGPRCRSKDTVCRGMGRAGQDRFSPVLEYGTERHKDARASTKACKPSSGA